MITCDREHGAYTDTLRALWLCATCRDLESTSALIHHFKFNTDSPNNMTPIKSDGVGKTSLKTPQECETL